VTSFRSLFGRPAEVEARAPGRVNLIGEHTDYNGGWVLPLTLARDTAVDLAPRPDARVRVWSAGFTETPREYRLGAEAPAGDWLDYLQGVTWALRRAGHGVGGADMRIVSTVPAGSGLASSAALEVAVLRALRAAYTLDIDDVGLALLARRAETDFVGAPVGVMDQMAASVGAPHAALLLDSATLTWSHVPLPAGVAVMAVDSGIRHRHAGGEYRTRKTECEQAAARLGVPRLCELSRDALPLVATLPPPLDRRARHVITENARVHEFVAALTAGKLEHCGRLLEASHASLRDDFEISLPALDALVDVCRRQTGVYGARLTGGGFGGSLVVLLRAETVKPAADAIVTDAVERLGLPTAVMR
jgi:galactokinase